MVRPLMALKVVHSLRPATHRALCFHNVNCVGMLHGIQTVVGPEVAIAVFFRREALPASTLPGWALPGRIMDEEMPAVLFAFD
jgi:hypothetical protein